MTGKMFEFITKTWNPIKFCSHNCSYCWAKKYGQDAHPILYIDKLKEHFTKDDFVFVCDMGDLFCNDIPECVSDAVLLTAWNSDAGRFLLMTKNPARYDQPMRNYEVDRIIYGCTVESNRNYPTTSNAPLQSERLKFMQTCYGAEYDDLFISIEPILDFDLELFANQLLMIKPWAVAIGYDNYNNKLPEPRLFQTMLLVKDLESHGIKVYRKTLRKAWNEGVAP